MEQNSVWFEAFTEAWSSLKHDKIKWKKINKSLTEQEINSIETFVKIVKENK